MKKHTRLVIILGLLAGLLAISGASAVSGYYQGPNLPIAANDYSVESNDLVMNSECSP